MQFSYQISAQVMELQSNHTIGEGRAYAIHPSIGPEQKNHQTMTGISGKVT